MGKSELSHIAEQPTGHLNPTIASSLDSLKLIEEDCEEKEVEESQEMTIFDRQVAGHLRDGKHFGMVKFKDAVLKPILKPEIGEREVEFYEHVENERKTRADLMVSSHNSEGPLWKLVPQYFGQRYITIDGRSMKCLALEDLTRGFMEPCIMDVKIGRRTWDSNASLEKITRENLKYKETKQELGICIPGFQVYDAKSGKLRQFGKDFGKKLDRYSIIDAFKTFLNAEKHMSRQLLLQLLVALWGIQHWARKQTSFRLYSSSILLIYDARGLRHTLQNLPPPKKQQTPLKQPRRNNSLYRPMSMAVIGNDRSVCTGFSGQFDENGPIFPHRARKAIDIAPKGSSGKASTVMRSSSLKRVHSFHHNYDEDLQCIRSDYAELLEDLVSERRTDLWATAKMIDFAHTTRNHNGRVDENYLEGVENLVQILEGFLADAQEDS